MMEREVSAEERDRLGLFTSEEVLHIACKAAAIGGESINEIVALACPGRTLKFGVVWPWRTPPQEAEITP